MQRVRLNGSYGLADSALGGSLIVPYGRLLPGQDEKAHCPTPLKRTTSG
jgi:hypothetical protein